jgi:hypothetical protein
VEAEVVVADLRRGLANVATAVIETGATEATVAIAIVTVVVEATTTTAAAAAAVTVVTTTMVKATTNRLAALRHGNRHPARSKEHTPATPAILPTVALLAWVLLRACLPLLVLDFPPLLLALEGLTLSSSSTPALLRHPRLLEAREMLLLPLPLRRLAMCPRLPLLARKRLRQTNLGNVFVDTGQPRPFF